MSDAFASSAGIGRLRLGLVIVMVMMLAASAETQRASAQSCQASTPRSLVLQPYTGHWDAYNRLACLEQSLIARGDRRAIFTSVYTLTTLRMAEAIDAGFFANTAWMQVYQTEFANYYRQAFLNYENNMRSAVPTAWLRAFDAAVSGQTLIIQDVLLGMNAHITRDLAFALEDVDINPRGPKYADHTLVNDVLADVSDEVTFALAELYGTTYAQLDAALGELDELMLAVGFQAAREGAWGDAVSLDDSAWWNRWAVVSWIESTTTTTADLVRAAIPPLLHALAAPLEGSNPGSTFCQHFTCS